MFLVSFPIENNPSKLDRRSRWGASSARLRCGRLPSRRPSKEKALKQGLWAIGGIVIALGSAILTLVMASPHGRRSEGWKGLSVASVVASTPIAAGEGTLAVTAVLPLHRAVGALEQRTRV